MRDKTAFRKAGFEVAELPKMTFTETARAYDAWKERRGIREPVASPINHSFRRHDPRSERIARLRALAVKLTESNKENQK